MGANADAAQLLEPARFHEALRTRTPHAFVTPTIVALNVAVYLWMVVRGVSPIDPDVQSLLAWGANYGPRTGNGEWWRLFTSMFLHGGVLHLAANMFGLLQVGMLLERLLGNAAFAMMYLLTGVVAGIGSMYVHPGTVSVGASGAIFGIYGVGLVALLRGTRASPMDLVAEDLFSGTGRLEPTTITLNLSSPDATPDVVPQAESNWSEGRVPQSALKPLRAGVATFVLYNVVYGFGQAGIDVAAHLSGLAAGAACGWPAATNLAATPPPTRRVVLVGLAGALLCIALGTGLRGFDDVMREATAADKAEERVRNTLAPGVQQAQAGSITPTEFAGLIERDVIPELRAVRLRVEGFHRVPRDQRRIAATLRDYLRLREESLELLAEAVRENNAEKMQQANARNEAALKLIGAPQQEPPDGTASKERRHPGSRPQ